MRNNIDRHYVSEIDLFLAEFDEQHPEKSATQLHEIKRAARLNRLRDYPTDTQTDQPIWQVFNDNHN